MELQPWRCAERVLCVRLDGIGDVLMTTPAMRALGGSACLTLLTSSAAAAVAPLIPELDDFIVYDPPWMKSSPHGEVASDLKMVERLRERGFDAAVIFTTYSQSALPAALVCYLAEIPLRLAHCRENPYHLLSNWVADPESSEIAHEVRRQLDLVATVGAETSETRLSVRAPAAATRRVRQLLREHGLGAEQPFVCIHPGASAPSRRYPPHLFAAAADEILDRTGYPTVVVGGCSDKQLVDVTRASMRHTSISLGNNLDLAELVALIEDAAVLVANNSAPAHIAAAVQTPVVDLYALTNPQHTPWQVPNRVLSHDVPCRNCLRSICPLGHNSCLYDVPPVAVADAVCELLSA